MHNRAGASGSLELGAREVSIVPDVGHVALQVAFGLGGAFDGPPPNCWTHICTLPFHRIRTPVLCSSIPRIHGRMLCRGTLAP